MIKYKTSFFGQHLIEAVEVDRETESHVFIGKRRFRKGAIYETYYNTWEDAKKALLKSAEKDVESALKRLKDAYANLARIHNLKR